MFELVSEFAIFPQKNNHSMGSTLDVVIKWQSELLLALSDVTCFEAILIKLLREKNLFITQ